MPSNSLQQALVKRSIADGGDLYFVKSPFYWQENNPSALAKTWHGYLKTIGHENDSESASAPENKTEFESEIIRTNFGDFRRFIDDGQKFGTINITNANAESAQFEMLKRMYGSVAYIVFEERECDRKDPRKKHERHIAFLTEYDLCVLNKDYYHSDESYYHAIIDKTIPFTSVCKETSFEQTRKKLYRNGFSLVDSHSEMEYASSHGPTKDEYFSNLKREQLNSQDMMNLLWKSICDAHREEGSQLKKELMLDQDLTYELYKANIVGFGWMPCLFAKQELNELDRCVLYLYEKANVHSDMFEAVNNSADNEEKSCVLPGIHKILIFKNKTHDKFQPIERYPLDKVVKISRAEFGQYMITDVNGNELLTDKVDLVADVPQVDIMMSKDIPGRRIVTGRYADGRCIKYEMDERDWQNHCYEIDKYIPGSLDAIKAYNLKRLLDNAELSIPTSYSIPLTFDGWNNIKISDNYSQITEYTTYSKLPVPDHTWTSDGTYSDIVQATNKR